MILLLRKGQFGEKSEKEIAIFLIFALMFLRSKKAISYHLFSPYKEERKLNQQIQQRP